MFKCTTFASSLLFNMYKTVYAQFSICKPGAMNTSANYTEIFIGRANDNYSKCELLQTNHFLVFFISFVETYFEFNVEMQR